MKLEHVQLLTALASNPELAKQADSSHRTFAELLWREFRDLITFVSSSDDLGEVENELLAHAESIVCQAYVEGQAVYTSQVVQVDHLSSFTFVHRSGDSYRISLRNTGLCIYRCDNLPEAITISDGASEFISRAYPGDVHHVFDASPTRFCAGVIKIARPMTRHLIDAYPNIEFGGISDLTQGSESDEPEPSTLAMPDLNQVGQMTETDLDDWAESLVNFHEPKSISDLVDLLKSLARSYGVGLPSWASADKTRLLPDRMTEHLASFLKQSIFPQGRIYLIDQIKTFILKWDKHYQPSQVWIATLSDSGVCGLLDHLKWRSEFAKYEDEWTDAPDDSQPEYEPEPDFLQGWLDARLASHGKLDEIEAVINSMDLDSTLSVVLAQIEPYFLDRLHILDFLKRHYHVPESPRFDVKEVGSSLALLRVLHEIGHRSKDLPEAADLIAYTMQQTEALAESMTTLHGENAPHKVASAYGLEGASLDELMSSRRPIADICLVMLQQAKSDYRALISSQTADTVLGEEVSYPITYPTATEIKAHFQAGSLTRLINSWLSSLMWNDEKIENLIANLLEHYNSTGIFEKRQQQLGNGYLSHTEFIREVLIFAMAHSNQ